MQPKGVVKRQFFRLEDAPEAAVYDNSGERVDIVEFADEAQARTEAGKVTTDGYAYVATDGRVVHVDWVRPPHFFLAGRAIVLYIGTNESILSALCATLGAQFAGS